MEKEKKESTLKRFLNSEPILFLKDLLIILLIVLIIRLFIAMPFQISWTSMKDSYYDREFIIVDRISYLFWTPKRWDVIVFRPHVNENKEYFLKRIIWIPWDELKIQDWEVFIKPKGKTEFIKINVYWEIDNLKVGSVGLILGRILPKFLVLCQMLVWVDFQPTLFMIFHSFILLI